MACWSCYFASRTKAVSFVAQLFVNLLNVANPD